MPQAREVAAAYEMLVSASTDGALPTIVRQLERMLVTQSRRGQLHYAAITSLNLAQCLVWLDQPEAAIQRAHEAQLLFEQSSRGYEIVSVRLAHAQAHAHLAHWGQALNALTAALDSEHPEGEFEATLEAASLVAWFGPIGMAADILSKVDRALLPASWALHWRVIDLWLTGPFWDGAHPDGPARGTAASHRGRCPVSVVPLSRSRAAQHRRHGGLHR